MKPLLHLGSNVITDKPLLHLGPVITLVPSTSSTDKKSGSLKRIGLRGNQTFSLPWWLFQESHIFPYFLPYLTPGYVSFIPVCKWSEGQIRKLRVTLLRSKVKNKFTLFVCGEEGITNPLKTPANQVQDYIGGKGTFDIKGGQKWNSPKLILFHKCFNAQRGRISSLLPNSQVS